MNSESGNEELQKDEGLDVGGQPDDSGSSSEGRGADGASNEGSSHDAAQRALAEAQDRHMRLMAEFENFRKRSLKEQSELLKYQGEKIILDLLDVLDNLELALNHSGSDPEKFRTGVEMIHKLFVERLGKWDVRGESGMGAQFDPVKHAAISRVPSADAASGTIVGELKKAYYYKDKLIRPGEVVVAVTAE